jgi:hypothetical protein
MIASSLVTEIEQMNEGWSRPRILSEINNLVQSVTQRETDSNVYVDPSTGDMPFLATTAGTFTYTVTIPGVTFWKLEDIVTLHQNYAGHWSSSHENTLWQDTQIHDHHRSLNEITFGEKTYHIVPTVKTQPIGAAPASVTFRNDPGTQTSLYRIMAFQTPALTLSESSQIPIQERLRYETIAIICMIIDAKDNGRYADLIPKIKEFQATIEYSVDKDTDAAKNRSQPFTY